MNRVDAELPSPGLLSTRWGLLLLSAVVVGSAIVKVIAQHGSNKSVVDRVAAFVNPLVRAAKGV